MWPQVSNSLPQVNNSLPQVDNSLPQVDNSLPQVDNSLPQVSKSFPQVRKSLYHHWGVSVSAHLRFVIHKGRHFTWIEEIHTNRDVEVKGLGLILSPVSTPFFLYFTSKHNWENSCFIFFTGWENTEKVPGNAEVLLTGCGKVQAMQIDKAEFIRPNSPGDNCTYLSDCCRKYDECRQDIAQSYPSLYQSIRHHCEEQNSCHISVPALQTVWLFQPVRM